MTGRSNSTRSRTIALIGHSGVGKSRCLRVLGIDRESADMDCLPWADHEHKPTLRQLLDWLTAHDSEPPAVIVICNHETFLNEIHAAKRVSEHAQLNGVRFVYLRKPKDELESQLKATTTGGRTRSPGGLQYTLENYEKLDALYRQIADHVIDCARMGAEAVAEEVWRLVEAEVQP